MEEKFLKIILINSPVLGVLLIASYYFYDKKQEITYFLLILVAFYLIYLILIALMKDKNIIINSLQDHLDRIHKTFNQSENDRISHTKKMEKITTEKYKSTQISDTEN